MMRTKIVWTIFAAALFVTPGKFLCAANQGARFPALAVSDSPWNVLAYGGKGEMHGAPICHPLAYFSGSPMSLDFDNDFYGQKTGDLTTQAKVTYLGAMAGRKVYEVIQTVRRPDGLNTNQPPTMKILLVERQSGEFCDIYEDEYAYDATNETDEAVIINVNGRKVLKTYETDNRTWFEDYWAVDQRGPLVLNTDAIYKAIQSASPAEAEPFGALIITGSHFSLSVFGPDDTLLGTVGLTLAVEGSKIVVIRKTWVPAQASPNPQ